MGITLRVTDIALSYIEAHEDTWRKDGPPGRRTIRILDGQGKEAAEQGNIRSKIAVNLVVLG